MGFPTASFLLQFVSLQLTSSRLYLPLLMFLGVK